MHRTGEQQRRDRRVVGVGVAVRQDDHAGAVLDGRGDLLADLGEPGAQRVPAARDVVEPGDEVRREAGHVAVVVDAGELRELVVVHHRHRQHDATARRGRGVEQVGLRPEVHLQRGDELLAVGVQRRVGDLREELDEVVEQHAAARRERRERGVVAHRARGLGPALRHRAQQQRDLLAGVAEGLLAAHEHVAVELVARPRRQVGELDHPGVQPLVVGVLGGELALDLVVVDDPAPDGVDEEHAAGLEAALAHDRRRVDVEHADLGAQDDEPVLGDPVAGGTQAVAVEHRADHRAVGERRERRAVPGLHQRRVVAVEGAPRGVHLGVVLPRLGDHHQHGVRQRAPAEVQQLEHLVEGRRVAGVRGDDREQPVELGLTERAGGEHRLARGHPVAVAAQRVDLAVVREVAVRVREAPRRERVGGEAAVHQRDRAGGALVGEVGEERLDLLLGEHPLVDDGAPGQAREVGLDARGARLVLDALAQGEGAALEGQDDARVVVAGVRGVDDVVHLGRQAHEELAEARHDRPRGGADAGAVGVDGQLAPREDLEALLRGDVRDDHLEVGRVGVGGQEGVAHRVAAGGRELDARLGQQRAVEPVRDLDQDSRAVAGVGLGAPGTPVLEVDEGREATADRPVVATPRDVGDEGDAAGVVFEGRVVEALGRTTLGEGPRPLRNASGLSHVAPPIVLACRWWSPVARRGWTWVGSETLTPETARRTGRRWTTGGAT